jgi:hypothetical protein
MIVDAHTHISPDRRSIPSEWREAATAYMLRTGVKVTHYGTAEDLARRIDENKIDKVCLLPVCSFKEHKKMVELNNFVASAMRDNPKFEGFASVNPHLSSAGRELERAVVELGLKGLTIDPNSQRFRLSDDNLWSLLEVAKTLDIPITVHAEYSSEIENKFFSADEANETVFSFPDVNFIFTQMARNNKNQKLPKVYPEKNVYYDTSHSSAEIISAIIEELGTENIVYGSDFKYNFYPSYEVEKIVNLEISDEVKEKILWRNVSKLLGITIEKSSRFGFLGRLFRLKE